MRTEDIEGATPFYYKGFRNGRVEQGKTLGDVEVKKLNEDGIKKKDEKAPFMRDGDKIWNDLSYESPIV